MEGVKPWKAEKMSVTMGLALILAIFREDILIT